MADVMLRNGKTLSEALGQVSRYKKPVHDRQGKPYYKYEEYRERMDNAFGSYGYEAVYSDFETIILPCIDETVNQVWMKAVCTICIYGENGDVVMRASGIGTKELERDSERKHMYLHANNMGFFVQQAAFKSAAKALNIFDCSRYDEESGENGSGASGQEKTGNGNNEGKGNKSSGSKKTAKEFVFRVDKQLDIIKTDTQTNMPVYQLTGYEFVGDGKYKEKPSKVILYPNCYKKHADRINRCISSVLPYGIKMKVSDGKPEEDYEGVYIFKDFA